MTHTTIAVLIAVAMLIHALALWATGYARRIKENGEAAVRILRASGKWARCYDLRDALPHAMSVPRFYLLMSNLEDAGLVTHEDIRRVVSCTDGTTTLTTRYYHLPE